MSVLLRKKAGALVIQRGVEHRVMAHAVEASIQETLADVSLHPVIVLTRSNQGIRRDNYCSNEDILPWQNPERYVQRLNQH